MSVLEAITQRFGQRQQAADDQARRDQDAAADRAARYRALVRTIATVTDLSPAETDELDAIAVALGLSPKDIADDVSALNLARDLTTLIDERPTRAQAINKAEAAIEAQRAKAEAEAKRLSENLVAARIAFDEANGAIDKLKHLQDDNPRIFAA